MNNIKYIILDFGKVLAAPTTGHWFITPKFTELIDMNEINEEDFNRAIKKYNYILDKKIITEEEEYESFCEFYKNILTELNYSKYNYSIVEQIAYDFTYNSTKYTMYEDVVNELDNLSKKYTLLLLSDNWPCAYRVLKEYGIYDYFDKIYISSVYGCQKSDGIFFDYPINDYKIEKGEAIFIDDNESLLDIACDKGLETRLMVRDNKEVTSQHEIINNLKLDFFLGLKI